MHSVTLTVVIYDESWPPVRSMPAPNALNFIGFCPLSVSDLCSNFTSVNRYAWSESSCIVAIYMPLGHSMAPLEMEAHFPFDIAQHPAEFGLSVHVTWSKDLQMNTSGLLNPLSRPCSEEIKTLVFTTIPPHQILWFNCIRSAIHPRNILFFFLTGFNYNPTSMLEILQCLDCHLLGCITGSLLFQEHGGQDTLVLSGHVAV